MLPIYRDASPRECPRLSRKFSLTYDTFWGRYVVILMIRVVEGFSNGAVFKDEV
jgi:hypothetical protein